MGWYEGDSLLSAEKTIVISTDDSHTLVPTYELIPIIAQINWQQYRPFTAKTNTFFYRNNKSGVEATLKVDEGFDAEHYFVDQVLVFTPRGSWPAGMGFTFTFPSLPLQRYSDLGAFIRYLLPQDSALPWCVLCGNSESSMTEIKDFELITQNDEAQLHFVIPEACKDSQTIMLRFESAEKTSGEPFQLSEFCFFGERMANQSALDVNATTDDRMTAVEETPSGKNSEDTGASSLPRETAPPTPQEPQGRTVDKDGLNEPALEGQEQTLSARSDEALTNPALADQADMHSEQEEEAESLPRMEKTKDEKTKLLQILVYGLPVAIILLCILAIAMILFFMRK